MKLIDHKGAPQTSASDQTAKFKEFLCLTDVKKGDILTWNAFNWSAYGAPSGDNGATISGYLQPVQVSGDPYFSGWQKNTDFINELATPIVSRRIPGTDKSFACHHGAAISANGAPRLPGGFDAIIAGSASLMSGDHATVGYFPDNSESLDVCQLNAPNNTKIAMAYWDGNRAQMVLSAYTMNSLPLFKPKVLALTSFRPDGYTKGNKRIAALSDGGFVVFGEKAPSQYAGYTLYAFERFNAKFESMGVFNMGGYPWRNSSYGAHSFTANVTSNDVIVSLFVSTGTSSTTFGNANLRFNVTKADGTIVATDSDIPLPSSMKITACSHQSITFSKDNTLAMLVAVVTLTDSNAYVISSVVNIATGGLVANTSIACTGSSYYVNREYAASACPISNAGFLLAYTDTPFAIKYIHYDTSLVAKGTFGVTAAAGTGGIHLSKFVQNSTRAILQFSYCDSTNAYYMGAHVINFAGAVAVTEWLDDALNTGAINAGQTSMHKLILAPNDRPPPSVGVILETPNIHSDLYASQLYSMATVTANGKSGYYSSTLWTVVYRNGALCIANSGETTGIPLWGASDILFMDYVKGYATTNVIHLFRQRAWNNLMDAIYLFTYADTGFYVPVGVAQHDAAAGEKVIGQISGTATLRVPFSRRTFFKSSDLLYPGLDMIIGGTKCQILDSTKAASLPSTPSIQDLTI
ncbi:MAG: hypothetical protein ACKO0Z_13585 [Betaproteobacteria bacterium]